MLHYLLVGLHIVVSLILILVVLLQTGKSADLAGAFGGGGSQTAFGSRGAATFLSKMTTTSAVIFMLTSFSLSIFSARGHTSLLESTGLPAASAPPVTGSTVPEPTPVPGATPATGDAGADPSALQPSSDATDSPDGSVPGDADTSDAEPGADGAAAPDTDGQ
ncbi:MAG: preprotein translocase subunit SecG [Acidobacteriota bacterium]